MPYNLRNLALAAASSLAIAMPVAAQQLPQTW